MVFHKSFNTSSARFETKSSGRFNEKNSVVSKTKREHSVEVPRLYKESAKLFRDVQNGGSIQSLIYSVKHRNLKAIYGIVCKAIRNNTLLDEVLKESGVMNEKFDVNLAKILASELLLGKKTLAGDSKPVQLMMSFKSQLETALASSNIPVAIETGIKPRYARVNTTLTTVEGTIKRLEQNEYILIDTPVKYDSFLNCAINMKEDQFMKDFHFEDVLVFPPKSDLFSNEFVENGLLILQDKASCLAPLLLDPTPGSVVLDMCAAPGLKTVHLSSLMKNKGTLFAVEKDPKRFNLLQEFVTKFCGRHNCVQTLLADAVSVTSEQCPDVKYILVDPTCSGSGMTKRVENQNNVTDIQSKRIEKLSGFQERILIQALTAFPEVKRVVYSTCSILKQENEEVIKRVLARVPEFQVVDPGFKKWERRGDPQYSFGSQCLISDFDGDLTNGMFIAVLEKISFKSDEEMKMNCTDAEWQFPKSRKDRKRKSDASYNSGEEMLEPSKLQKKIGTPKKKIGVAKKNTKTRK